jgi:maleate isomerase
MQRRIRLGVLTPSSNTALEPLTQQMLAGVPGCSAHFARFGVTRISLAEAALGQFQHEPILQAASLLADARVDVIAWSGTAAGWMGFEQDQTLCRLITERTGIPATSSVLALNELLDCMGLTSMSLVTPYVDDVQQRIVDNYRAIGVECPSERHRGIEVNFEFAEVTPEQLADDIRTVAAARPQAVATYCTNLRAAALAERLEQELGIVMLDTVSTCVWGMLRLAGADPAQVRGWGRLFQA